MCNQAVASDTSTIACVTPEPKAKTQKLNPKNLGCPKSYSYNSKPESGVEFKLGSSPLYLPVSAMKHVNLEGWVLGLPRKRMLRRTTIMDLRVCRSSVNAALALSPFAPEIYPAHTEAEDKLDEHPRTCLVVRDPLRMRLFCRSCPACERTRVKRRRV